MGVDLGIISRILSYGISGQSGIVLPTSSSYDVIKRADKSVLFVLLAVFISPVLSQQLPHLTAAEPSVNFSISAENCTAVQLVT